MRLATLAAVPLLLLATNSCSLAAQDLGKVDDRSAGDQWGYLLAGWRAEREKLQSWDIQITGLEQAYTSWDRTGTGDLTGPSERREIKLQILSDHAGQRSRNTIRWGTGALASGIWNRGPGYLVQWQGTPGDLVEVLAPTAERAVYALDLDPRAVGPLGPLDFKTTYKQNSFDLIYDQLSEKLTARSSRKLGKGRHEVILAPKKSRAGFDRQVAAIINEANGFTIESYRLFDGPPTSPGVGKPLAEILVQWGNRGGVWVPIKLHDVRRPSLSVIDLTFDWTAINKAADDASFALEAIGAPDGTMIIDRRLGDKKAIILGKIGDGLAVKVAPMTDPPIRRSTTAIVVAAVAVPSALLLAVLLLYSRGKKRP